MKRLLYKHQLKAFHYASSVEHPALFLAMRLGKSLITIRRILLDIQLNYYSEPILIVAPYSAIDNWYNELILEGIPESEISLLLGDRFAREVSFRYLKQFALINKEGFRQCPYIGNYTWGAVVADESTFLKNPKSQVSKYFTKHFQAKRRFILTGSPAPEGPLDLYQQLKFLDPSILGFKNYWAFRETCFRHPFHQRTGIEISYEWELKPERKEWFAGRLKKYCMKMTVADAGLKFPRSYMTRSIDMPEDVRKIYRKVEKEFLLEIEGKLEDATIYATEKFLWLRQICGGIVQRCNLWNGKIDVLVELLKGELFNQQVVVWAAYNDEIYGIWNMLTQEGINAIEMTGTIQPSHRSFVLKGFTSGNFQVAILQPEAYKFSTDLSCADIEIFYSRPLPLLTNEQAEARLENVRKPRNIMVLDLLVKNSVDEDVYWTIRKKDRVQNIVRNMMQRI